jgi:hypothetical protein
MTDRATYDPGAARPLSAPELDAFENAGFFRLLVAEPLKYSARLVALRFQTLVLLAQNRVLRLQIEQSRLGIGEAIERKRKALSDDALERNFLKGGPGNIENAHGADGSDGSGGGKA